MSMYLRPKRNLIFGIVIILVMICVILTFPPDKRDEFSIRARIVAFRKHHRIDGLTKTDFPGVNRKLRIVSSGNEEETKSRLPGIERAASSSPLHPTALDTTSPMGRTATDSISPHRPLFPKSVWFALFFLYHFRRCAKRRQPTYEVNWFVKSVDCRLNHYGVEEYERDFLSIDGSNYGSMSKWNGEELNKFDV